ncbi:MAG TPA: hypothetical protein DEQ14_04190 [Treponema sp.]|nr:hypothetical protein [Treponema sp.]
MKPLCRKTELRVRGRDSAGTGRCFIFNAKKVKKIIAGIIAGIILAACQAQIDPRDTQSGRLPPDLESPLIGTAWRYETWGQTLYFESAETVIHNGTDSYEYFYDKAARAGRIGVLGSFTVTADSVTADYKLINFPDFKGYGHGADFTRID